MQAVDVPQPLKHRVGGHWSVLSFVELEEPRSQMVPTAAASLKPSLTRRAVIVRVRSSSNLISRGPPCKNGG